jgi:glycosyltransferase involved in cell wall biosynthesis
MSLRILHVIIGLNNGGAEGALYRLAAADRRNTHEVVSMMDVGVFGRRLAELDVRVHTLEMPRGRVTLRGIRKLLRLIRHMKPDLVQTWMYHADLIGGIVAKLAGRATVVWSVRAADAYLHPEGVSSKTLVRLCARLSWVVPRTIVTVSNSASLAHTRIGYCGQKMTVIPNGYDVARLVHDSERRAQIRREWGVEPHVRLIGTVARWNALKDHETLAAALSRLNTSDIDPWACALVGPDMLDTNRQLTALLDRHQISDKVRLIGPVDEVSSVMNAFDIHVLSSKSEAFPNVLAEAMACTTPCVATDVGDARHIVGSTGWIVPPSDPTSLARAMRDAFAEMTDASAWERRRALCRARVRDEFSIQRMVDAYDAVWKEAIARS